MKSVTERATGRIMSRPQPLYRTLGIVAAVMLAGMFFYELTKELFLPDLTKWQSHYVTIIFSTVVATIAAYFVRHKIERRNRELRQLVRRKEALEEELRATIDELQGALDHIQQLRGMFPICSFCKKIRDDDGFWNSIETYIEQHSEAVFSHSVCPDCVSRHYGDMMEDGESTDITARQDSGAA